MLSPKAPWCIASRTMPTIFASSSAVGARFAVPITRERIVLCPASQATFIPSPTFATESAYVPNGEGPPPSGPPSASVTPCRT